MLFCSTYVVIIAAAAAAAAAAVVVVVVVVVVVFSRFRIPKRLQSYSRSPPPPGISVHASISSEPTGR